MTDASMPPPQAGLPFDEDSERLGTPALLALLGDKKTAADPADGTIIT